MVDPSRPAAKIKPLAANARSMAATTWTVSDLPVRVWANPNRPVNIPCSNSIMAVCHGNGLSTHSDDDSLSGLLRHDFGGVSFSGRVHVHHSVAGMKSKSLSGASDEPQCASKADYKAIVRGDVPATVRNVSTILIHPVW